MPTADLTSAIGALALVVGLIVLLRFGARLVGGRRFASSASCLALAGQLGLDGKRRLYLVKVDGGQVLVLTGGSSDAMLAWPARPELAP